MRRKNQYTQSLQAASGKLDLSSPIHAKKGLATHTEAEPVIANTTKMIRS